MKTKEVRNLKVCYRMVARNPHGHHFSTEYVSVPCINLIGKWLKASGFEINTPIKVECSDGRLVITRRMD